MAGEGTSASVGAIDRGRRGRSRVGMAVWFACLLAVGAASHAHAEHSIAVVVTESSVHHPYGAEILAGAEAIVRRLNADGGVLGQPVRITSWTEDCTSERAVQVATELARLKPAVVIGHVCPAAALAAAPIYTKAGLLFIAPGVRHPRLTGGEHGTLVLRLAGRDDRFAVEATRFIESRYPGQRAAVIGDRTRQGRALADGVAAELRRRQIVVALDERIESGERSYEAVARRVRNAAVGVVVMPAQPIELGLLITSLRQAGIEAPVVGSEILAVPAIEAVAREQGRRLVLMLPWMGVRRQDSEAVPPDGDAASDAQREAVRRQGEAAVQVWAAAVVRAGTTDALLVAAAARTAGVATVVGSIRFDAAGDAMVPGYVPSAWLGGRWTPLGD